MDILEEIDETIKDKKGKWNYTPMREKNETDALIDELLKEFSSDNSAGSSYSDNKYQQHDYNTQPETYEREEYNRSVQNSYSQPVQSNQNYYQQPVYNSAENNISEPDDKTQVFSRAEIESYENNQTGYENTGGNDNYSNNSVGGFDDDYYDENDFNEDCESLDPDNMDLDEAEYAELENYIESHKSVKIHAKPSMPKRILKLVSTALIAAFTIIGIFSSVLFVMEKFDGSSDADEEQDTLKTEIAKVVYPIAVTGTDDFAAVEDISGEQLVAASIWEIIINGQDLSMLTDEETGNIVIPHSQIEYVTSKLFGIEENIEPCDVAVDGIEIKYDKSSKSYVVPAEHDVYTVYPEVSAVKEQDGIYTVSVDYYSDGPSWTKDKKTAPDKNVVFTLKKTSDYYNIISAVTNQ